ncbi:MAG: thioredoxin-disulfide reductase [Candidatus Omnitrophica bacterium]|nr:thioredoxin-disulfide reductase [Candidatus Omnitrophota bacterium]
MSQVYDTVIIGAGPAGLTAGIYAARFGLQALILEKLAVGGQIILSSTIENYPGFPGGISTFELMDKFKTQVEQLNIKIEEKQVRGIEVEEKSNSRVYRLQLPDTYLQTKTVIVASGAQPKKLGIKGEDEFIGKGVSYCGTCDAPFFRDKEIVVVGGGDRAIEEAIFLSHYARKVTIVHRRNELRAAKILIKKTQNNPKINFVFDSVVEEIQGENNVRSVLIKNVKTNSQTTLSCAGVFIFVGIQPNTGFLKNFLEMDKLGFIITDDKMQTSKVGIFACGDCRKKDFYQVITACAEGAIAANSCHKYLMDE